mmetsp:Transcript_94025/g.251742  ORF Transcript_94025/g.251742 Transcript_94025/m.251742 type:complete len:269 (+) Transcript_94025:1097-1903(+)
MFTGTRGLDLGWRARTVEVNDIRLRRPSRDLWRNIHCPMAQKHRQRLPLDLPRATHRGGQQLSKRKPHTVLQREPVEASLPVGLIHGKPYQSLAVSELHQSSRRGSVRSARQHLNHGALHRLARRRRTHGPHGSGRRDHRKVPHKAHQHTFVYSPQFTGRIVRSQSGWVTLDRLDHLLVVVIPQCHNLLMHSIPQGRPGRGSHAWGSGSGPGGRRAGGGAETARATGARGGCKGDGVLQLLANGNKVHVVVAVSWRGVSRGRDSARRR